MDSIRAIAGQVYPGIRAEKSNQENGLSAYPGIRAQSHPSGSGAARWHHECETEVPQSKIEWLVHSRGRKLSGYPGSWVYLGRL